MLEIVLDMFVVALFLLHIPLDIVAIEQTRHSDSANPFAVPAAPACAADTVAADAALVAVGSAAAASVVVDFAAASAERTAESGFVGASAALWQDTNT